MSADSNGRTWDWADDADDVVVQEQPPVAIYVNPRGEIVLRQPAAVYDENDDVIFFAPEHALAIAKAIMAEAGLDVADIAEPAPEPAPCATKAKDPTGAERQRRRRARQKEEPTLDIERDDRDADRDADRDESAA